MKALKYLGGAVALLTAIALSAAFSGYALTVLWGWFIVPIFHLPQLNVVAAIGVALTVGYLTNNGNTGSKDDDLSIGAKLAKEGTIAILKPTLVLFIGWIVHMFM